MEKEKIENNDIRSSIAPISRETIVRPAPKCDCKQEQEEAELQSIISYYQTAVNNARSTGYQAANDPGYSDPGLGLHKVGNCADWAKVSWGALVVWKWKCWTNWTARSLRTINPVPSLHRIIALFKALQVNHFKSQPIKNLEKRSINTLLKS